MGKVTFGNSGDLSKRLLKATMSLCQRESRGELKIYSLELQRSTSKDLSKLFSINPTVICLLSMRFGQLPIQMAINTSPRLKPKMPPKNLPHLTITPSPKKIRKMLDLFLA